MKLKNPMIRQQQHQSPTSFVSKPSKVKERNSTTQNKASSSSSLWNKRRDSITKRKSQLSNHNKKKKNGNNKIMSHHHKIHKNNNNDDNEWMATTISESDHPYQSLGWSHDDAHVPSSTDCSESKSKTKNSPKQKLLLHSLDKHRNSRLNDHDSHDLDSYQCSDESKTEVTAFSTSSSSMHCDDDDEYDYSHGYESDTMTMIADNTTANTSTRSLKNKKTKKKEQQLKRGEKQQSIEERNEHDLISEMVQHQELLDHGNEILCQQMKTIEDRLLNLMHSSALSSLFHPPQEEDEDEWSMEKMIHDSERMLIAKNALLKVVDIQEQTLKQYRRIYEPARQELSQQAKTIVQLKQSIHIVNQQIEFYTNSEDLEEQIPTFHPTQDEDDEKEQQQLLSASSYRQLTSNNNDTSSTPNHADIHDILNFRKSFLGKYDDNFLVKDNNHTASNQEEERRYGLNNQADKSIRALILLLHKSSKQFELVSLEYNSSMVGEEITTQANTAMSTEVDDNHSISYYNHHTATTERSLQIDALLQYVTQAAKHIPLQQQSYRTFCTAKTGVMLSNYLTLETYLYDPDNKFSLKDDFLIAIPESMSRNECVSTAQKILQDPEVTQIVHPFFFPSSVSAAAKESEQQLPSHSLFSSSTTIITSPSSTYQQKDHDMKPHQQKPPQSNINGIPIHCQSLYIGMYHCNYVSSSSSTEMDFEYSEQSDIG